MTIYQKWYEAIINTPQEKKEDNMKEILKELVEAQKEANRTNKEILGIWREIENNKKADAVHRLASTLVSMKYIRDEYALLAKALQEDVDREDLQESIDDLVSLFGSLSIELDVERKLGFTMLSSRELVEMIKEEKAAKEVKEPK